ncbi:MAG: ABC transporter ATP-binding protein/permease [Clostridiales bacterium]|nr:ABC transporter ATP-binding protein/permease [Clostridiales bacterium]MDY2962018.1 ABC transporter ATP-binding protein/permease [Oscillospiraceae bacterium]
MLELKNIVKDYETGSTTVRALKGISISFRESEFVAILGQSGCGKTTLLNIIGGLDRYTSGDLIINGKSTKEFTDRDWDTYRNHSIGFVFQSYNLIPHQTVLSNVELALTLSGVSPAERRKRAIEVLEKVGLGDQLDKAPNQMSGGQMQRVAIARALVNDPDILLADEPTGALDSETSVQIMDLLKEISHDKLIIMVTHNPELAERYATRTVRLLDGTVIGDTAPCTEAAPPPKPEGALTKPSMSFKTALGLSLNNLMTKKARTFLTAFAGSIGIIGIALILSLSNGIQHYIDDVQEDTLSSYPLTIQAEAVDLSTMVGAISGAHDSAMARTHDLDKVYSNQIMYDLLNNLTSMDTEVNNLTAFKAYLESPNNGLDEYISTIQYGYDMGFAVYTKDEDGNIVKADVTELLEGVMSSMYGGDYSSYFSSMGNFYSSFNVWQEMLSGKDGALINDTVKSQYDMVYGHWPENYDEVVLVVDKNNEISDLTLYALGLKSQKDMAQVMMSSLNREQVDSEQESWSYEDLCGRTFKVILPSEHYEYDSTAGTYQDLTEKAGGLEYLYNSGDVGIPLKIVGIVRPNGDAVATSMQGAIGYTAALTDYAIDRAAQQDIIAQQLSNPDVDVFTGEAFPAQSDAEHADKVSAAKQYVAGLSGDALTSVLIDTLATPSDAYLNKATDAAMAQIDRDSIKQMAASAGSDMDAEQINEMIDSMDDTTLMNYASVKVRESIAAEYKAQMKQLYAGMSPSELTSTFTLLDDQYEYIYDTYMTSDTVSSSYDINLKKLGYVQKDSPSTINIYATAFADKDKIADAIENYNNSVSKEDQISYTDYVALLMSSITTIINAISYVLIAFVAISLVVSSIMIGIITYISVLERTKEIGILRSIGASKQDISRVFNAETLIEGFAAGVIGIGIALLLLIPINLIVHHLTGISNLNAILPWLGGVLLVLISMALTFIAGLIPSGLAAKKDPVVALRTE